MSIMYIIVFMKIMKVTKIKRLRKKAAEIIRVLFGHRVRIILALILAYSATYILNKYTFGSNPRTSTYLLANVEYNIKRIQGILFPTPTPFPIQEKSPSWKPNFPAVTVTPTVVPSPLPPTLRPYPTYVPPKQIPPVPLPPPIDNSLFLNHQYSSISVVRTNGTPEADRYDLDLDKRGYLRVDEYLGLVSTQGPSDFIAPQFATIFSPRRNAAVVNDYQAYDENGYLIKNPAVTLIDLQTNPGEAINVPKSGYDIGGSFQVMVLYAKDNKVTLKYTREDDIVSGYTLYIENVNISPNLISLYQTLDNQGRKSLPALHGGELIGVAASDIIRIAIRDTGSLMDPRVGKDWWQSP